MQALARVETQSVEKTARRARILELMENSKSQATRKAYARDWAGFSDWCDQEKVEPLPASPAQIVGYIDALEQSGKKGSTIRRALASIAYAHKLQNLDSPTRAWEVLTVLKGLERREVDQGIETTQARAILRADLARMVESIDTSTPLGLRNRALLLVGWAGAFRRSELTQIDVGHLEWTPRGLVVLVPRSKTDQLGKEKRVKVIPMNIGPGLPSPVAALREWLESAQIADGPVFRGMDRHGNIRAGRLTSRVVSSAVTSAANAAGFSADGLSAHSLRAGWVTQARLDGLQDAVIIAQAGWRTGAMLSTYTRPEVGHLFDAMEQRRTVLSA